MIGFLDFIKIELIGPILTPFWIVIKNWCAILLSLVHSFKMGFYNR